jgi:hypothetical protein
MKHLSLKAIGPALAIAAILSLGACTATTQGVQGCDMRNMNCCAKMHCCKMQCCKDMKGCCCCNGKIQGCPYTPKPKAH